MNFWDNVWRQTPLQLSDFPVLKVVDDQHDGWLAYCILLSMPDHWDARERKRGAARGREELVRALRDACGIDVDDACRVSVVVLGDATTSVSLLLSFSRPSDAARFAEVAKVFLG